MRGGGGVSSRDGWGLAGGAGSTCGSWGGGGGSKRSSCVDNSIALRNNSVTVSVSGVFLELGYHSKDLSPRLWLLHFLARMVASVKETYFAKKTNLKLSTCDTLYQNSVQITSSHIDTHTFRKTFVEHYTYLQ